MSSDATPGAVKTLDAIRAVFEEYDVGQRRGHARPLVARATMITLAKIVCAWLAAELSADFWTPFIDLASRASSRAPNARL
jgi:hypothetical protein